MKKAGYKKKIIKMCQEAGTYAPYFDMTIDKLAYILEVMDDATRQYKASGGHPVIAHVNRAKEKNLIKNPALVVINELSATALSYWRDLGLTPKGLKSLGESITKEDADGLENFLSNLGV